MLCPLHTSTGPFSLPFAWWPLPPLLRTLSLGMKKLLLRLVLVSTLSIAALSAAAPALAEDGHGAPASAGSENDVVPAALWSLAGVAAGAVVLGALYFFKRGIGGFPENPSWVAPISITRSRDLPGDGDSHGHGDSHGGHAPAH